MKKIKFTKMSASGNDFVVIDNRKKQISEVSSQMPEFVRKVCQRKMGIGADGVLLIEDSPKADFKMRVFNPDGGEVEMCGNGARCVALYEFKFRTPNSELRTSNFKVKFETMAGILEAEVISDNKVKLKMSDPVDTRLNFKLLVDNTEACPINRGDSGASLVEGVSEARLHAKEYEVHSINTGVPHVVLFTEDLEKAKVKELGKKIRYHKEFAPEGTNANFIKVRDGNSLDIRTYERGVEDETLACGTGACASAIISHLLGRTKAPTKMHTRSGSVLTVYFDSSDACLVGRRAKITNLYLEGDAEVVYEGEL